MGCKRVRAIAAFLHVAALATRAHAEANAVSVSAPCPIDGTTVAGVVSILRAQLGSMPVEAGPSDGESTSAVQVTVDGCHAVRGELEVVIDYRGERHLLQMSLGDIAPIARDRTLALVLAESIQHVLNPPAEGEPSSASSAPPATLTVPAAPAAGPIDPTPATPIAERPAPSTPRRARAAAGNPQQRDNAPGFTLLSQALARYTFETSTAFAGLDAGGGVGHFELRLRGLVSSRSVQDSAVWQGALLAVFSVHWLKLTANAGLRSELELGAALAAPRSGQSAQGRGATSPHWGGATYLQLRSPISQHWAFTSELGIGAASSLTSQAYRSDLMSLSGVFLQASFGLSWGQRERSLGLRGHGGARSN